MRKFIDFYIPTETCNLRCHYCYITQKRRFHSKIPEFGHSPEFVRQAFSQKRWGGELLVNLCAGGETLLCDKLIPIIREFLSEGHYVMVVTNGTLGKRFEDIAALGANLLKRLFFKFSFHYLELKRLGLIDAFFENVELSRKSGCSYTVEITPCDELEPHIDDIKEICLKRVGALCHVTVPRDVHKQRQIELLSKHSLEEFYQTWNTFDSSLIDFKKKIFYVKRTEFCYAGALSYFIDLDSGDVKQCYRTGSLMNVYDDISEPIKESPIGHECAQPHCYNGHAFLALGVIPELDTPTYASLRDRVTASGETWLSEEMRRVMSRKLTVQDAQNEKV